MYQRICSTFTLLLCLLAMRFSYAQNAQMILNKSLAKCRSIRNGSYELILREKFLSEKDTVLVNTTTGAFVKHPEDSIFGSFFHVKAVISQQRTDEYLYSGTEFIDVDATNHDATFFLVEKSAQEILDIKHNYTFYKPFTDVDRSPLSCAEGEDSSDYVYRYNGLEAVSQMQCYHIQLNEKLTAEEGDVQTLRVEYHFWIDRKSWLPLRYSISTDVVLFADTMYQYEEYTLKSYRLNQLKQSYSPMSDFDARKYVSKGYAPVEFTPLLPIGSKAPDWKLTSLTGTTYSLESLKGKWVLIDFFFRSCYPCMKAFPILHDLQEKYAAQGLIVIGMDGVDQNDEQFQAFLSKHRINYPVILGVGEMEQRYQVSGYPTIYLIDPKGVIRYAASGVGHDMEAEIGRLINTE